MKTMYLLALAICSLACAARAKTVAYWPLNYDVRIGATDLRSVAGPFTLQRYQGSSGRSTDGQVVGVPPNLDAADLVDRPDGDGNGLFVSKGMLSVAGLDAYLDITNSWTVEGWFRFYSLPTPATWTSFFTTRDNLSGWLMTLRNYNGRLDWELFGQDCVKDNSKFAVDVDPDSLTNSWHHYALVHNRTESGIEGKGVWHFYVDGVECPSAITNTTAISKPINVNNRFTICGRRSDGRNWDFHADAIRVSDVALLPSQFLNASPAQPRAQTVDTLGYWRLDAPFDIENLADTPYYLQFIGQTGRISGDHAYDAIPNASSGLPDSNASFISDYRQANLSFAAGGLVDFDKAFTLEGWFKCIPESSHGYLFGTRNAGYGFTLWYNLSSSGKGNRGLTLYARTKDVDGTERTPVNNHLFNMPVEPLAGRWAHIALTHDPAAGDGNGVWEVFVDGVSMGTVTGTVPSSETSGMTTLLVGGRTASENPIGLVDTVRLTKRVLAPSEFLCTVGGTSPAASDVAGLWPLNREGAAFALVDLKGNYSSGHVAGARCDFVADRAVETVPNPPADVNGNPARNAGSLQFPANATLASGIAVKGGICPELNLTQDFTVEGWLRFDRVPSSGWQIVWNCGNEGSYPRWWLACRVINGAYRYISYAQVAASTVAVADNTIFPDSPAITSADIGKWKHHALVYHADAKQFELFIDGVSGGVVPLNGNLPASGMPFNAGHQLNIGGRTTGSAQNFPGSMDTLRITKRALAPSEFLNAAPAASAASVATTGYWKLDSDGTGTSGLASSVPGLWNDLLGPSLAGSAEGFGVRVRNPDTSAGFVGDARTNAGSVRVTTVNGLVAPGVRRAVSIDRAFTLEGWIKWDGTGTFPQAIASTDGVGLKGLTSWTLALRDADTFAVTFRDSDACVFLQGTFPAGKALANTWTHLAFSYSPRQGLDGQCELFIDGVSAGVVSATVPHSVAVAARVENLSLGSSASANVFQGLFDTWRLSGGVLEKTAFLHQPDSGSVILLR